jgi:integrase
VFVGPDGRRVERSTSETNAKAAADAAAVVLREEYAGSRSPVTDLSWDAVMERLVEAWQGNNLRAESIKRYRSALSVLRSVCPKSRGPLDITEADAVHYKHQRAKDGKAPITIAEGINCLCFLWNRWLMRELKLLIRNPWADVEKPEVDDPDPAIVTGDQIGAFQKWLDEEFPGWRLPHLFLAVKSYLGCRIGELSALRADQLVDGRIEFKAAVSKSRKNRSCMLPAPLYKELKVVAAGHEYVWEDYHNQLRQQYLARGERQHAAKISKTFIPRYWSKWFEDTLIRFRRVHPEVPYFKLHSLRATAISEVRDNGVTAEAASFFFGVTTPVMEKHYTKLNEAAIADRVAEVRMSLVGEKWGSEPKSDTPQSA